MYPYVKEDMDIESPQNTPVEKAPGRKVALGCFALAAASIGFAMTGGPSQAAVAAPAPAPEVVAATDLAVDKMVDEADLASSDSVAHDEPTHRKFVDPFADLTDEELEALTDDEFFAMLEDAGIDPEDEGVELFDDIEDPFADLTDEEFEAMTDDEFFAILDEAGIDVDELVEESATDEDNYEEDSDEVEGNEVDADERDAPRGVEDPFAGMTDEEIDALSYDEFVSMLQEAGVDFEIVDGDFDENFDGERDGDHDHDHDASGDVYGPAPVAGDTIDTSDIDDPEVAAAMQKIWSRFAELVPASARANIVQFEMLKEDGAGAHVYPVDEAGKTWTLGVSNGLGKSLDAVLIHELGHTLTLDATQATASQVGTSCVTYDTGDSCAKPNSIVNQFVSRFWPADLRAEVERIGTITDDDEFFEASAKFAEDNEGSFVTDYASGNPVEDLAEVFSKFVTEDKPTGDSVADQKINFLWEFPELVELRAQIVENAGGDVETYEEGQF